MPRKQCYSKRLAEKRKKAASNEGLETNEPETKKAKIAPRKSKKKPSTKPTNVKNFDKPEVSDEEGLETNEPETKKAKIAPSKSTNVKNSEKPEVPDDIEAQTSSNLAQAAEIRIKGNAFFGKFKNSPIKGQQKGFLTDAVQNYEEALKLVGNDEKYEKEKASICKNLAISLDYLTQLEARFISTRLHLWQKALEYYVMAIHYGKLHGIKWLEELCGKFEKCYSNLNSDEQTITIILNVLYNAGKMNHSEKFGQIARGILMDYGDDILTRALEAISDKKYKIGLPLLHELHRPIEEAKKYFVEVDDDDFDFEEEDDDDFDKGRLRVLEKEYHTFMAIGEALQAYYNGIDILDKAESMTEDHEKTKHLFGSLDFFRRAAVLVKGEDAEVIAMALTKIGIIYHQHLGLTIRAKDYFKEAMDLASVLTGNKYTHPWYMELTSTMQKIQEAVQKAEDEEWENKRKPFMEKLEKDGTITKIWAGQEYSVKDLIEYVLKNWPPQHLDDKNWKPKVPTLTAESTKTEQNKALVKVLRFYHPDKITGEKDDEGNTLYKVKCEEITKLLTSKYTDCKMMG